MIDGANGWLEWKQYVLAALDELKVGQKEAAQEARDHRQSMSLRLDALEKLQAEQRGGWKVVAWISGPAGALAMFIISKFKGF